MIVRAIAVGVVAGFTAGLFGVGGGIVIVPGLVALVGLGQRVAHGTSLAAIVVIAATGAFGYATAGEVDWAAAAALVVGGLPGTVAGTALLHRVDQRRLQTGFAVLLLASAARLLLATPDAAAVPDIGAAGMFALVAVGAAAGLLAGLMGVGGGIITVPALSILLGFPLVIAKGTSLAVIAPTAALGTIRNRAADNVELRTAAIVGTAGVATAFAASKLSLDLDPDLSARLFAGLLVVTAIKTLASPASPGSGGRQAAT